MGENRETCPTPDNTFSGLDLRIPEDLLSPIQDETYDKLFDCFIDTLNIISPDLLFQNMFIERLKDLAKSDFSLIQETEGQVISDLVFQIAQEYLQKLPQGSLFDPEISFISINGVVVNYSHIKHISITTDSNNNSEIESSLRPLARPEELTRSISERSTNQYNILKNEGFSRSLRNFSQRDFIPLVLGNTVNITEDHIERLEKFLCFLIDIETYGGTQMTNGVSTATSYTQTLNEANADRENGKYNSIDTRIRTALIFYNNWEITRGSKNSILNIPEDLPRAQWVGDLWKYNVGGRDMINFSFDSELKLTLIFLASRNPEAMNLILTGNQSEQSQAAQSLYHTHHTNVEEQGNTQIVMMQKLLQHYS